jgi:hypothetical protein
LPPALDEEWLMKFILEIIVAPVGWDARALTEENNGYFDRPMSSCSTLCRTRLWFKVLNDRSISQIQFHQVAHVLLRRFLNYANVAAPMIFPRQL